MAFTIVIVILDAVGAATPAAAVEAVILYDSTK